LNCSLKQGFRLTSQVTLGAFLGNDIICNIDDHPELIKQGLTQKIIGPCGLQVAEYNFPSNDILHDDPERPPWDTPEIILDCFECLHIVVPLHDWILLLPSFTVLNQYFSSLDP
jgi:hypothetical protein